MKIVVIGAGFAGHTAALYLGDRLGRDHEVTVINKFNYFLYIPSLIWVGVDGMNPKKARFPLSPVYDRLGIHFVQGTAKAINADAGYVQVEQAGNKGKKKVDYDYLIVATGPRLNWDGTPGMGPMDGHTHSICWVNSAVQTRQEYLEIVKRMEKGEKVKMVIGVGHPGCTCQGAAFEYIMNIHHDLIKRGLRDKAFLHWFSNEPALGDFGIDGLKIKKRGSELTSEDFIKKLFEIHDITWEVRKGARQVDEKFIHWEDYDGDFGSTEYDFAMLIPQFLGTNLKFINRENEDITPTIVNSAGFVLVDGYYGLSYEHLHFTPEAWPAVYQNQQYRNIFAAGIAFAPPGPISRPHVTKNNTMMVAAPPRTGMVSGIIGRLVALNIIGLIEQDKILHQERMTEMFTACVASMGKSLYNGSAVSVMVYPIVPNYVRYPHTNGRDMFVTHMEEGLSSAWIKRIIHTTMMYKQQARPGWKIIPE